MSKTTKTPKTTKPMSETAKFLSDVIITALEGGIGYWSAASEYRHGSVFEDYEEREDLRTPAYAVIHEMDEDEGGYKEKGLRVDNTAMAKAFKRIMDPKQEIPHCDRDWRKRLVAAYWAKDAGDLDAGDADAVVQIAVLGEVVYG